jgi:hypothetical protein
MQYGHVKAAAELVRVDAGLTLSAEGQCTALYLSSPSHCGIRIPELAPLLSPQAPKRYLAGSLSVLWRKARRDEHEAESATS